MIVFNTPAKLNLFLDILSKRKDGYHNIISLMVKVDLYDVLSVGVLREDRVSLSVKGDAPEGAENSCYRAAKIIKDRYCIKEGLQIKLEKRIPSESGLGGASSNAAYVLRAAREIFDIDISKEELMKLGAAIGSDVPFFVNDSAWAVVEGKGERVRSIDTPLVFSAVLILPQFGNKTEDLYRKWKPSLTESGCWDKIELCSADDVEMNFLKKYSYNVFEKLKSSAMLFSLREDIKKFDVDLVRMTGTGSAIYAISSDIDKLNSLKNHCGSLGYNTFLVRSLD
ncbi:MAG: 4-(cytidine 5'-diphospho)-2-C-methyl-D-erythritol kinase [Candidatus Kaelpia imicola]|nr:4-(cytidine 5'-diphospho)-2-C-methyl-D-erythritol kinase [Candidatus Kaelpia imicola]